MKKHLPAAAIAAIAAIALGCTTTVATTPVATPAAPSVEQPPSAPPAPDPVPAAPPTSVLNGVYTEAQAERGQAAFIKDCAECHGEGLGGGEMAPGLTGVAFSFRWRGLTLGDIYTSVRSTMPPDVPGTLGNQEYVDIVAFVLSANKYPAGERELAADSALLEGIAVERIPP